MGIGVGMVFWVNESDPYPATCPGCALPLANDNGHLPPMTLKVKQ